jgi:hypothetical protein
MRILFAGLLLALAPAPTFADGTPAADVTRMKADDCARARKQHKTCVLTIEDEKIDGSRPRNTETEIIVTPFGKHGSLIRVRRDFIAEIMKSAEDL